MTSLPPGLTPEMLAKLQPPNLRDAYPGRVPRRVSPAQVGPFVKILIASLNKELPARFTITEHGPYKLTIDVDVNLPELPPADGDQPESSA